MVWRGIRVIRHTHSDWWLETCGEAAASYLINHVSLSDQLVPTLPYLPPSPAPPALPTLSSS